jgi:hypothetical protein
MKYLMFLIGVVGVILCASEASASMSCGGRWVNKGMTKMDVISICGQPDLTEVVALNTVGDVLGGTFSASTTSVEAWHYNCGAGRFNRTLYFEAGKLAAITTGNYGTGTQKCS